MTITRWSPIFCLPKARLTPSGLLELGDGEVEILTRKDVGLRIPNPIPISDDKKEDNGKQDLEYIDYDANLVCTLTTHRLVFLENIMALEKSVIKKHAACYIHLSFVGCASSKGFGILASPKLKMTTYSYGDVSVSFEASRDRDEMLTSISRCLGRKAWEATSKQRQKAVSKDTAKKVGVDAILSKNKEFHEGAKRISEYAFSQDVEGLMIEARDLVLIINKYVATLENKKKLEANSSANGQATLDEEEERLSEMLSNMGMMSAITKKSSGSLYHQQLAQQLADFLIQSKIIIKQGGMVTLTDVYCLFNRARGANMITPDDMLTAAKFLKDLHLGYEKREFVSGVVVLQSVDYSDQMVSERLKEMSRLHPSGLTVFFVSSQLKTNTILAMEQLQTAESMGYLCRDTTIEGIRFFENKFVTW